MNNITIATWNISGGVSKDVSEENYFDQEKSSEIDESFLKQIIKLINKKYIDIICFQEIITTERINYINKICDNTKLKYKSILELSECNLVQNTDCGIAILSKYPINKDKSIVFTNPKLAKTTSTGATYYTYDKGAIMANISIGDKEINIITNHGFPFRRFNCIPENHLNIYEEFSNFINQYENVIITGDFNAENIKTLMPNITKRVNELFGEITTTDGKRFDNILIDRKFKMINKEIIELLSDHFLCITNINI
ncbi:MAG TPA: hypothetical protein DCP90_04275 [Clostridiales bacterium]|nr:MAG: hypothetical protein A2Y22_06990 [Clostridiales bacterium GWD2_32_59]HAN09811.1 hypothetical protein [Clostridiales bacterium]